MKIATWNAQSGIRPDRDLILRCKMSDVTRILQQINSGDSSAAEQLLPLVYEELRKLAAARLAEKDSSLTLQATDLVHEAYIRLVDTDQAKHWNSRGHFFGAAAKAMRRILVELYRQKQSQKRGGGLQRVEFRESQLAANPIGEDLLALNDALDQLSLEDPVAAELATLRIFGGMSLDDAAQALELPHTSAYRQWIYAQAWLKAALAEDG